MDFSRIENTIDTARLKASTVAIVGVGGARDLACNLARCGVARFRLFDPDTVEFSNVCRQGHTQADIGAPKVLATAGELTRINPEVEVIGEAADFTRLSDEQIDDRFGDVDLVVLATDRFAAQARGNEVALRLNLPAVWIGLYAGGLGGEVIFWHPGIMACYRCLCAKRYEAHKRADANSTSLDPTSDGATIFDVQLVDAIAGQIAIGLLTRGSDTRYGRLVDELGDRNFIQVQLDPHFQIGGRDVIRQLLGVPEQQATYFSWNTIVRSDPDGDQAYCADCERFRGWLFTKADGTTVMRGLPPGTIH